MMESSLADVEGLQSILEEIDSYVEAQVFDLMKDKQDIKAALKDSDLKRRIDRMFSM